jgi:hypothetical protein
MDSRRLLTGSRKHTGERPFQCHCSRRFSRLDNLRQHAQTVHINEEIPQDSLAATGTRFQRQVRTDRVRPPGGNRSRASTAGSQTPGRGHHRNSLSASSINSMGSYTSRDDARRRPPPLQMANGSRLSGEITYRPGSPNGYQYRSHSPGGFSTPTSATFSTGQNSPRWGSAMQSPITTHSRTQSIYDGHRTPGRRLSVPSAGNPFQSPHSGTYGPPTLGGLNPKMGYSPSTGVASPTTSSNGSLFSRRESISSATDDLRRRTWHPETYSNFTSRLQNVSTNYYSTGPPPTVPVLPSNAPPLNNMRLPGIESFDPLPRPQTPTRRQPSPMMIDTPSRAPDPYREERPTSQHWDMNRNLHRLELGQVTPQTDAGSWASDANRAVQAQAEQAHPRGPPPPQQTVRFEESPYTARSLLQPSYTHQHAHAHAHAHAHTSAPPLTPKEAKRHGWYHGPSPSTSTFTSPGHDPRHARTSPEDSSSSTSEGVPGTPSSASEIYALAPGIVHSNGFVDAVVPEGRILHSNAGNGANGFAHAPEQAYGYSHGQPPTQQQQHVGGGGRGQPKEGAVGPGGMSALDTLVAAATSQENTAAY